VTRHGEGYISKRPRKDGRWAASLTIDGRRYSRYAKTQRGAREALAQLKSDRDASRPIAPARLTLAVYLAEWLETSSAGQAAKTRAIYEQNIRLHIAPHIGNVKLGTLSPAHLRRLYLQIGATLSPASIGIVHGVLHVALEQAYRDGVLPRNVADLVTPPRKPQFEASPLTTEQARAFLEAARGEPLEALWLLMLTTGARIGELLAARWPDIDYERRTLSLHGSLVQRPRPGAYLSEGKGAPGRRNRRPVQLTAATVRALQARRAAQAAERLKAGPQWQDTGEWVFTSRHGKPWNYSDIVKRHFRPLLERAGLPPCRPHDLRHSVATLLLAEGVHPRIVADLLGHSTTAMTTDRYSHVSPTLQGQASEVLERLLGG
jgi:integrase